MSFVQIVVAVLSLLVAAVSGATCPCNDSPPMADYGETQYSCEEQKNWGQCGQEWMQGFCECACGICAYEPEENGSMAEDVSEAVIEPMAEPAPKPKKNKKSKKNRKAKKAEDEA